MPAAVLRSTSRFQRKARQPARLGGVVETNFGRASDVPSGGGREANSYLRSSNGGGGSGSGGEGTGGDRETSQRLRLPRHPTSHPSQIARRELPSRYFREEQVQPGLDGRIARVDCREDAWINENRRAAGQTGIGARGDVRVQRGQRTIPDWITRGSGREYSLTLGRYTEVRVLRRIVECDET